MFWNYIFICFIDECQRKTQSIQNYKEETEKIKRQGIDEGEDIKNQAKVLRQKYTKDKNKAKILEKQCLDLEEKRSEAVARTSLYEPLLKKLGVKVDKMACKGRSRNNCSYVTLCITSTDYG